MNKRWLFFTALTLFTSILSFAEQNDVSALLHSVKQSQERHNIPAIGLVLIKDGQVEYANALGVLKHNTEQMVDAHTLFRLGSISKSILGIASIQAQKLGLFRLDDNVSDYLGDDFLTNPWHANSPVKIHHLIEHTAGLYDITSEEFGYENVNALSLNQAFQITPESREVKWEPGYHSVYSNLGAPIVALIIEKQSGLSYESFVERYIFSPLEMTTSSFFQTDLFKRNGVAGHRSNGTDTIPYWHLLYRPFGALNSSPQEFAKLLAFLVNQRDATNPLSFNEGDFKRLQTPETTLAANYGLQYGYGLGVYADDEPTGVLFGHGGTAAGHLSEFRYSPDLGIGYFVSININNRRALSSITRPIKDYLTSDFPQQETQASSSVRQESLKKFEGYYKLAGYRSRGAVTLINVLMPMRAVLSDNILEVDNIAGLGVDVMINNEGKFFEPDKTLPMVAAINHQGVNYIQTDKWNLEQTAASHFWLSRIFLSVIMLGLLFCLLYALVALPKFAKALLGKARRVDALFIGPFIATVFILSTVLSQRFDGLYFQFFANYAFELQTFASILLMISTVFLFFQNPSIFKKLTYGLSSFSHIIVSTVWIYLLLV